MRVAVLGLGAIGRVVAAALASRVEVIGVDRTRAPLAERPSAVDAAIVCVKTPGTTWAGAIASRVLRPGGLVLTLQNGLGNRELLAGHVGAGRVAAGALYLGVYVDADDRVHLAGTPRLVLSSPVDPASARIFDGLVQLLRDARWEVEVVPDATVPLWTKVVVNAAINPTTAILGIENGMLPAHAAGARVADVLAAEASRVATAAGVRVTVAEAAARWRDAASHTAANRSSMLEDVRAGRETEIDSICGAIAREGERLGIPAPLNAAMVLLVGSLRSAAG